MRRLFALLLLVGCYDSYGLGEGSCDEPCLAGPDGSVRDGGRVDGSTSRDASVPSRDAFVPSRDASVPSRDAGRADGGRRDAGSDPIFDPLPDDPPPDIGIEPGTSAYYLYELCWRSRTILCDAASECCDDEPHQLPLAGCAEELGQYCQRRYLPGGGAEHVVVDLGELARAVEQWAEAAAMCARPPDLKITWSGTLARGERCDFVENDPYHNSSLCEPGLYCNLDGVCAEVAARGEPCEPGAELGCEAGFECGARVCVPLAPVGTECFADSECRTQWCDGETQRCSEPSPREAWCVRT